MHRYKYLMIATVAVIVATASAWLYFNLYYDNLDEERVAAIVDEVQEKARTPSGEGRLAAMIAISETYKNTANADLEPWAYWLGKDHYFNSDSFDEADFKSFKDAIMKHSDIATTFLSDSNRVQEPLNIEELTDAGKIGEFCMNLNSLSTFILAYSKVLASESPPRPSWDLLVGLLKLSNDMTSLTPNSILQYNVGQFIRRETIKWMAAYLQAVPPGVEQLEVAEIGALLGDAEKERLSPDSVIKDEVFMAKQRLEQLTRDTQILDTYIKTMENPLGRELFHMSFKDRILIRIFPRAFFVHNLRHGLNRLLHMLDLYSQGKIDEITDNKDAVELDRLLKADKKDNAYIRGGAMLPWLALHHALLGSWPKQLDDLLMVNEFFKPLVGPTNQLKYESDGNSFSLSVEDPQGGEQIVIAEPVIISKPASSESVSDETEVEQGLPENVSVDDLTKQKPAKILTVKISKIKRLFSDEGFAHIRMVPYFHSGKITGFKVLSVKPNGLWDFLQRGDIIFSVDDKPADFSSLSGIAGKKHFTFRVYRDNQVVLIKGQESGVSQSTPPESVSAETKSVDDLIKQKPDKILTVKMSKKDIERLSSDEGFVQLRAVPNFHNGEVNGIKVLSVKPDGVFDFLKRGDLVLSIDDKPVDLKNRPFGGLADKKQITFRVYRNNQVILIKVEGVEEGLKK